MVFAMFGSKISKVTTDQGREYLSKQQLEWYKKKGIQLETTIAYSPQQNGVAERFNRTLMEKVRTMLIESNVPKYIWHEGALAATYIINRCPTRSLQNSKTPAEIWYGEKPDLSKLRIFGCKAYAWIPRQLRKKLDSRSRKSVMVGYVPNGYLLWDIEKRKTFTARDVKFDESDFPYKNIKKKQENSMIVVHQQEGSGDDEYNAEDQSYINKENSDIVHEQVIGSNKDTSCVSNSNIITDDDDDDEGLNKEDSGQPPPMSIPLQEENRCEILRRSGRERRLPSKFLDFITGLQADSGAEIVDTSALVPENYNDIFGRHDTSKWKAAISDELKSIYSNKVWTEVKKPTKVKLLNTKWIFRIKVDENGNFSRYKARLVAKGFSQKHGVDYNDTYAPVAKLSTIRVVLAVGLYKDYQFHQLDVKTAFLNGNLDEDIYLAAPEGVTLREGMVLKLNKSLYGLKQAPRCWNSKFNNFMLLLGFQRSSRDYCLYTKFQKGSVLIVVLYVDDLLISGNQIDAIETLKRDLSDEFKMNDCGYLKNFLGIKIEYEADQIKLSQEYNIEKVLLKFGMADCNPVKTPMEKGLKLLYEKDFHGKFNEPYRELLGSLMYTMLSCRPDICYSVAYMGRFQQNPNETHWQHLKRVVRYLKGTKNMKLVYSRGNKTPIEGFADADWANDPQDRKSISGYLFKVYGCCVSWSSKKQQTVATSSSEAEYMALSSAVSEALWLRGLMQDLNEIGDECVTIYEDNKGCIGMATTSEIKRAKHIDVKHHFIRDNVSKGHVKIESISSRNQEADMFTKSLDINRFNELRTKIGIND